MYKPHLMCAQILFILLRDSLLPHLLSSCWGPLLSPLWPSVPVQILSVSLQAHLDGLQADSLFFRTSPIPPPSTQTSSVPPHANCDSSHVLVSMHRSSIPTCIQIPSLHHSSHSDPFCFPLCIHRFPSTPLICMI